MSELPLAKFSIEVPGSELDFRNFGQISINAQALFDEFMSHITSTPVREIKKLFKYIPKLEFDKFTIELYPRTEISESQYDLIAEIKDEKLSEDIFHKFMLCETNQLARAEAALALANPEYIFDEYTEYFTFVKETGLILSPSDEDEEFVCKTQKRFVKFAKSIGRKSLIGKWVIRCGNKVIDISPPVKIGDDLLARPQDESEVTIVGILQDPHHSETNSSTTIFQIHNAQWEGRAKVKVKYSTDLLEMVRECWGSSVSVNCLYSEAENNLTVMSITLNEIGLNDF